MKSKIAGLKIPLILVCLVSFGFGISWGIRLHRERELRAGRAQRNSTIRLLAYQGVFSSKLLERFEQASDTHISLTEVKTPEELWDKLETISSAPDQSYDLVTLLSYQVPGAFQSTRVQPFKAPRLKDLLRVSPDFRDLPGAAGFRSVLPLLWGITGLAYDISKLSEPDSWASVLKDPKLKGKISLPNSTVEILRLADPSGTSKDFKKSISAILNLTVISKRVLSAVQFSETSENQSRVAMVNHGEMAFAPLKNEEWKFTVPHEGGTFWTLCLALSADLKNENATYEFLNFMLESESAEELTLETHEASTNRQLETSDLDPLLKPSYLRQFPLSKIVFWKEFNREREVRGLLPITDGF